MREVGGEDLAVLKDSTSVEEWNEGGFATSPARYFVLEVDGEVAAAANLTTWRADFDDVGLLVVPQHRGNGYGLRLAGVVAAIAARECGVVRYRSRVSNTASVAIFKKLGFLTYCEQTAVRPLKHG